MPSGIGADSSTCQTENSFPSGSFACANQPMLGTGIFGATQDQLPLVGRVPGREGLWVSAGYSGHGNVMGLGCGELVAQAILGSPAPELQYFDPARLL